MIPVIDIDTDIHCDNCARFTTLRVDDNGTTADLMCSECSCVLATLRRLEPTVVGESTEPSHG